MDYKRSTYLYAALIFFFTGYKRQEIHLIGTGATFPEPFYRKLFIEYEKKYGVETEYHGIGSGGGIKQIKSKTVDFSGSDVVNFGNRGNPDKYSFYGTPCFDKSPACGIK